MIICFFDCVYNFVYMILIVSLCRSFCEKRKNESQMLNVLICVTWFVLYNILTTSLNDLFFLKLVATFILHIIGLSFVYKSKIYKLFFLLLLLFGIGLCADLVMFNIQKAISPNISSMNSIYENASSIIMGSLSLLLQLLIILVIKRFATNYHYDELNTIEMIKYSVFPVFSICIVIVLCLQSENISEILQLTLTIIGVSLLLIMNVYVFFFLRNESKHKIAMSRQALIVNHAEEMTEMYNQSCKERELQAKEAHEFKNIMSALEILLLDEKYEDAKQYLKRQNSNYIRTANIVNTGNAVVNAVFNTKYAEAIRKDIVVRFSINDLSNVQIEYTDIITILANLLNNSIEACEKCARNNRIIDVAIKSINDSELFICVKNTYSGVLLKQRPNYYKTTKDDSYNHGFGLQNIRNVVSKLNGFFEADNDEHFFIVTIVINYLR